MKYSEFKYCVQKGTITDLKPYITRNTAFRTLIAAKGQYVDELIQFDEDPVITTLIQHGYATEHYES